MAAPPRGGRPMARAWDHTSARSRRPPFGSFSQRMVTRCWVGAAHAPSRSPGRRLPPRPHLIERRASWAHVSP